MWHTKLKYVRLAAQEPKSSPPQPATPKASPSARMQAIRALSKQVADMRKLVTETLKRKK